MAKKKKNRKNPLQAIANAVSGVVQNVGNAAKNTRESVEEIAKNLGEKAQLAPIVPFVIPMKTLLKAKKVTPKKGLEELAIQFKQVVLDKRRNSFDMSDEDLEFNEFMKSGNHFVPPTVIAPIIQGIVQFFTGLAKAKEDGAKLSAEEEQAAKESLIAIEVMASENPNSISKNEDDNTMLYVIVGLVVLVLLMRN